MTCEQWWFKTIEEKKSIDNVFHRPSVSKWDIS